MSVHVFGCQHLIMDGDSVPDNYQLYGKVSVGPLAKNTSVTTQTKRGKITWNEVLNFPVVVSLNLIAQQFFASSAMRVNPVKLHPCICMMAILFV